MNFEYSIVSTHYLSSNINQSSFFTSNNFFFHLHNLFSINDSTHPIYTKFTKILKVFLTFVYNYIIVI